MFVFIMAILEILFCIWTNMAFELANASTVVNTFQSVPFLPDWTNSVYKIQKIDKSSLTYCASICIKELNENCNFFYIDSNNCFLGNLTLNSSGLAPLPSPNNLLINESKSYQFIKLMKAAT